MDGIRNIWPQAFQKILQDCDIKGSPRNNLSIDAQSTGADSRDGSQAVAYLLTHRRAVWGGEYSALQQKNLSENLWIRLFHFHCSTRLMGAS